MVKKFGKWGTVCDDEFEEIDAQAACFTLGFDGLESFKTHDTEFSDSTYPTNMDDVKCPTNTTTFLECSHLYKSENCGHTEDILLTCL